MNNLLKNLDLLVGCDVHINPSDAEYVTNSLLDVLLISELLDLLIVDFFEE